MNENEDYLRFCGKLLFGEGVCAWEQLTKDQQECFCRQAQKTGLEKFFVRTLKGRVPELFYREFRDSYQREAVKSLIESKDLAAFYQFFELHKIPFVPIKGADLAYRIYPDSALRPHGDWDILFRKEDCPKVLELLRNEGWKTFSGCDQKEPLHHHYERMHNNRHSLEVHWTLPNFGRVTEEEIWQGTEKVTEYHRVLTPEMNLLLLSAHAGAEFYTHVSQWKILQDAGMILQHDKIDWEKVHQLGDRLGILSPDVLLHLWSDFFPKGCLPPEDFRKEQQELLREIFATRATLRQYSRYEKTIGSRCVPILPWLKIRFKMFNASSICLKYHIPAHQNGKIIAYGIWDFLGKAFFFLTHFRSTDPELRSYYQKVAKLEDLVKHEKR